MLADQRVVAIRKLIDEATGARRLRRCLDLGFGGAEPAIGDVGAHRVIKQADLLSDDSDGATQRRERHRTNVLPIDRDAPLTNIEKPRDQVEDRRFARSRRADEGNGAARRNRQRDIVERYSAGRVAKRDRIEANLPPADGQRLGSGPVSDPRLRVGPLKDPPNTGGSWRISAWVLAATRRMRRPMPTIG